MSSLTHTASAEAVAHDAIAVARDNIKVLRVDVSNFGKATEAGDDVRQLLERCKIRVASDAGITCIFALHRDAPTALPSRPPIKDRGYRLSIGTFDEIVTNDILRDAPWMLLEAHHDVSDLLDAIADEELEPRCELEPTDLTALTPLEQAALLWGLCRDPTDDLIEPGADYSSYTVIRGPLSDADFGDDEPLDDYDRAGVLCCKLSHALNDRNPAYHEFHRRNAAAAEAQRLLAFPPEQPQPTERMQDFSRTLLSLPSGLGDIQRWVLGRMKYPSAAAAGVTALALCTHFAMSHITIDSYGGLGLNEQYLVLAPTGFGKEDLRSPFEEITRALRALPPPAQQELWLANLPDLQYSAPASQQGLHALLENNPAQSFLSDEHAEWMTHAASDSHKQAAIAHLMQAYSKANSTLAVPNAVTRSYKPVEKPRVMVFATSTAERILEVFNASQAESGMLNRFVMFPAEQHRIEKKYEGLVYEPPHCVVDVIAWIVARPRAVMKFTPEAWRYFMQHDSQVIEPLRFKSNTLAGRLSEQAIKIAALIALGDRRLEIAAEDLRAAYEIRENLYWRAAELIGDSGAISGMHNSAIAIEQLTRAIGRLGSLPMAHLQNYSKKYKALDVREREAVLRALVVNGVARIVEGRGRRLVRV